MREREKSLFKVGTRGFSWSVSKAILWNKIYREEKKCWYWKNFKSSGWMRLRCIRWMDKTIYNLSKVICWWGWKKEKERELQSEVKKVCWEIWLSLNNFFWCCLIPCRVLQSDFIIIVVVVGCRFEIMRAEWVRVKMEI